MNPPLLRPATAADIPALAERLAAMVQAMEQTGGHPAAPHATLLEIFQTRISERLARPSCFYHVAAVGGQIVGMIEASMFEMGDVFAPRWVLHIHGVYVDESARREGIGQHLMEAALKWGRGQGCEIAELNVLAHNPALHLYTQMGFQIFQYEMIRPLS